MNEYEVRPHTSLDELDKLSMILSVNIANILGLLKATGSNSDNADEYNKRKEKGIRILKGHIANIEKAIEKLS